MGKKPLTIVIFGITGDLARNKLIPSIFDLYGKGKLHGDFKIIGYGRKNLSGVEFSSLINESLTTSGRNYKATSKIGRQSSFIGRCTYVRGELNDPEGYERLKKNVSKSARVIYFFAVHPELHEVIISNLGKRSFLNKNSQILIEKPFGHNVRTALALDKKLCKYIKEEQIYRIDHYLGKSELIELINKRRDDKGFANALASDLKEVSVSQFETKTIVKRGAFYDRVGALKDIGQNHLLQMLAVVISSADITSESSKKVQAARAKALETLVLKMPAIKGQYISYHDEPGVKEDSKTETFFSIHATSKILNHDKVDLIISTGKALSESKAEIKIKFKNRKEIIFSLNRTVKGKKKPMDAYERVFLAALEKDQRYFCSLEEVIAGWKFDAAVRKFWEKNNIPLVLYKIGSSIHIPKK